MMTVRGTTDTYEESIFHALSFDAQRIARNKLMFLLEFGLAEFAWTIRLHIINIMTPCGGERSRTLLVSAVRPAEFSLVCRPLCGPGLGFSPLAKASRIALVVSGVRSSCAFIRAVNTLNSATCIEIVVDGHHRCIAACALTFHFNNGELPVFGCLAGFQSAEVGTGSIQNLGGAPQHTRRRCADLHKIGTYRFSAKTRVSIDHDAKETRTD